MDGTLPELLRSTAAAHPDRLALVEEGGRRLTWAELDRQVDRLVAGLRAHGFVAGYRVVVALPNGIEFVTTYLAVLRARLVAVPVNPGAAAGELVRVLADCGSRLVVADRSTVGTVRQAVAGLEDALASADQDLRARTPVPRIAVVEAPALPGEIGYDDLAAVPEEPAAQEQEAAADPESLAVLLYTSGTSGRPRGAMLSHRALVANVAQTAAVEPAMVTGDDVVLAVLPLFHVYGLNAVLGQAVHQGCCLVLAERFDPEETLALVERAGVSVLPVAPPVLAHWKDVPDLARRLGRVRLVLSGSAPLSAELAEEFAARAEVAVHQGYGLTEAAPVVTSTLCSRAGATAPKPGSVGAALPGIELRLVDDDGRPVEGDDPGEISVRGANLFSGYWPDGEDGPDEDGWFATGDVGFLDADGDLFLVDRLRELVIVSGFNVYPVEVEEVIAELDAVAEVAVIGAEDPTTGEAVVAYVRPAEAAGMTAAELADLVREQCAVRLARFKQPREVHVVAELPHTVTGKVAKGRLRAVQRRRHLGILE